MANGVFNISKGEVNEYVKRVENNDPAASRLTVILLKAVESDALLQDRDTVSAIIGAAANTEADFTDGSTPYVRKFITDTELTSGPAVDDANDRKESDMPDQQWVDAGGTTDNNLVKLLTGYDPLGTNVDANIIPLTYHDFVQATNGSSITAQFDVAGFFRAA